MDEFGYTGYFLYIRNSILWWTSTKFNSTSAREIGLTYKFSTMEKEYMQQEIDNGKYVRCIRD